MDNTVKDDLIAGEAIETAWGIGKSIQEKAILKKAKKLIAAGKANECTGRMIDICIEAGIDPKVFENNPKYMNRPEVIAAKAVAIKNSGAVATDPEALKAAKDEVNNTATGVDIKKLLVPGLVIIGIIILITQLSKK